MATRRAPRSARRRSAGRSHRLRDCASLALSSLKDDNANAVHTRRVSDHNADRESATAFERARGAVALNSLFWKKKRWTIVCGCVVNQVLPLDHPIWVCLG